MAQAIGGIVERGRYIAAFERRARERGFVFSFGSFQVWVVQLDFSKLRDVPYKLRREFYDSLVDMVAKSPRGSGRTPDGLIILGEDDADNMIKGMQATAAQKPTGWDRIRDIWCTVFIGGCP